MGYRPAQERRKPEPVRQRMDDRRSDDLDAQVDASEDETSTLWDEINALLDEQAALWDEIDALEDESCTLSLQSPLSHADSARLAQLESQLDALRSRSDALDSREDALYERIAQAEAWDEPDEGPEELDDASDELLDEALDELLDEALDEIVEGDWDELDEAWDKLEKAQAQLEEDRALLEEDRAQLEEDREELAETVADIRTNLEAKIEEALAGQARARSDSEWLVATVAAYFFAGLAD